MSTIHLPIVYDDSCKTLPKRPKTIKVTKEDIYSYGVFNRNPGPFRRTENENKWRNEMIPTLRKTFDDQLEIQEKAGRIVNGMDHEEAVKVSEIVGVGAGLKVAKEIMGYRRNKIKKIMPKRGADGVEEKRMDFDIAGYPKGLDIETKGITGTGDMSTRIKDIHAKKKTSTNGTKVGVVVVLRKIDDPKRSFARVTDPEGGENNFRMDVYDYIAYYLPILALVMDNPRYNKLVRLATKRHSFFIETLKIKYKKSIGGVEYIGQCFDDRLVLGSVLEAKDKANSLDGLKEVMTKKHGKNKYFVGIDSRIIRALNDKDVGFLESYELSERYSRGGVETGKFHAVEMCLSDGTAVVMSVSGGIPYMEDLFPESDVRVRLKELFDYARKDRHECGEICRSREKEGQSCQIKTFRTACHFHR